MTTSIGQSPFNSLLRDYATQQGIKMVQSVFGFDKDSNAFDQDSKAGKKQTRQLKEYIPDRTDQGSILEFAERYIIRKTGDSNLYEQCTIDELIELGTHAGHANGMLPCPKAVEILNALIAKYNHANATN